MENDKNQKGKCIHDGHIIFSRGVEYFQSLLLDNPPQE